ncbi:MAG: nicotinate-nucleotide adenylyltransferase [Defluviitaleaceae bacterium]|nr:nicotinate-nucleotide adenylyltransferase [Defluviitaleaceae bacterium]
MLDLGNLKFSRLGILGGTFDPIHYGHLLLGESVAEQLKLDGVLFVPSGTPPFKRDRKIAPKWQRFDMVSLAVADNPRFFASPIELLRENISYSVDTMLDIRVEYGYETEIFFIIGADQLNQLEGWMDIKTLAGLCNFAATNRAGHKIAFSTVAEKMIENYNLKIQYVGIPQWQISSTDIRRRIADNESVRYLIPDVVEKYIIKHGLYKGDWIIDDYDFTGYEEYIEGESYAG